MKDRRLAAKRIADDIAGSYIEVEVEAVCVRLGTPSLRKACGCANLTVVLAISHGIWLPMPQQEHDAKCYGLVSKSLVNSQAAAEESE